MTSQDESCESQPRVAGAIPFGTRTDVRTNGQDVEGTHPPLPSNGGNAHTRVQDSTIVQLGDVLREGFWLTDERYPVVRTGEREPIPHHVRAAILYRDRFRCQLCLGAPLTGPWHLDHILPWSAGGSDHSTNLRVLCETHNLERSNFKDGALTPKRAVTWWCHRCYSDERGWSYGGWVVECPKHPYNAQLRCRVAKGYKRGWEVTGEVPTWHQREGLTSFHLTAYCAHCNMPGQTDVTL